MYREIKVALSGQMEIGIGDGSKRMFNPGDILQVEDLTGQGHTTRSVGTYLGQRGAAGLRRLCG